MALAASTSATPNLEELAQRIRRGERAAETALINLFSRGIRAVVRSHCRPGEPQVDDLTQEVLASLLERLRAGAIQDPQALPHYLRVAIAHSCAAHYRRQQRSTPSSRGQADEADGDADPIHDAARIQRLACLRQMLAEMPVERDREVLRRFYLLDQNRARICAELGIDVQHFHRVIHRARTRLREALERAGVERSG